jgi:hypothetical protein
MSEDGDQNYRDLFAGLNKAITDKAADATRDRAALRDAICSLVAVEQARGTPLIIIIQKVDSILQQADETVADGTASPERDAELAKRLVEWCAQFRGD